jgi:hypothetical protein
MDLLDLLKQAGGEKSLGTLAKGLGLDSSKTNDLVSALAPALLKGLGGQAQSTSGLSGLQKALGTGNHQRYIDEPQLLSDEGIRSDGNNILGHLFGSKDVSRKVAAQAAGTTGIDVGLIKKALPMLAGLAMGALSKKTDAGRSLDNADDGLLGSLMGGADGLDLGDVMGLAKKFF